MPIPPFLAKIIQAIEDNFHRHSFIFIFFCVTIVFTTFSTILVTIAKSDPDNEVSNEEQRIFLHGDPVSPSEKPACSSTLFYPRSQDWTISEANVEGLLAAHRNYISGRFSEIQDNRIYFKTDPRDTLLKAEEGLEAKDEDAQPEV